MIPQRIASDPYYQFTSHEAVVGGEAYTYFTRPALDSQQESLTSALLLAESIDLAPGAQVLCMHCGSGLAGTVAARQAHQGHVTLLDCHSVAMQASRCTLAANRITNAEVLASDCGQAILDRARYRARTLERQQTFDSALALLPKGRAAWEQTILDAAALLRTGGALYMAGANRAGIKSAATYIQQIFGHVDALTYRGGCRVLRTVKADGIAIPDSDYYTWRTLSVQVENETIEYVTKPGLFAWKQLDGGTRLLIEALHERPLHADSPVLDVGCGGGVLTLVAARQARHGQVIGVDVDCRAVEATRRTLAHNEISNAEVLASDCAQAVADRTFGAVVTNPPFHQKQATAYVVAEQIIRDSARLLSPSGRLYLVANRFLKYEPLIEQAFGHARLLRETRSFRVWYAEKDRG
jgi:16S rRNA (guanine1207-N2)-methyltransferase